MIFSTKVRRPRLGGFFTNYSQIVLSYFADDIILEFSDL